jgi:hypothetical protein
MRVPWFETPRKRAAPHHEEHHRAAPIERSTASLGQQSTLSPADF